MSAPRHRVHGVAVPRHPQAIKIDATRLRHRRHLPRSRRMIGPSERGRRRAPGCQRPLPVPDRIVDRLFQEGCIARPDRIARTGERGR